MTPSTVLTSLARVINKLETLYTYIMTSKNILILSKIFSSNAPGRVEKFTRRINYLARSGWSVHLLTPNEPGYNFESQMNNIADSVSITISTLPSTPIRSKYYSEAYEGNGKEKTSHSFNSVFSPITTSVSDSLLSLLQKIKPWVCIPDSWVDWIPTALKDAYTIINQNDIDIIYTSCYPFTSHLVGLKLKNEYDIPWITEFRDPWVNNPLIQKSPLWKLASKRLEKYVLKSTDKIVIHNGWFPEGVHYFEREYPSQVEKVVELPYVGYDNRIFDSIQVSNKNDEFTIVHAGNFYGDDCSPEMFLRAMASIKEKGYDSIQAEFLGGFSQEYQHLTRELGIADKVQYHGVVPYSDIPKFLKPAHVGLWVMGKKKSYKSNVPSKVFDYIGAEIPILAIVPCGDCAEFIKSNGLGTNADPDDQESVERAIIELYEKNNKNMSFNVDPNDFSRSNSLAAMESTIQSTLSEFSMP